MCSLCSSAVTPGGASPLLSRSLPIRRSPASVTAASGPYRPHRVGASGPSRDTGHPRRLRSGLIRGPRTRPTISHRSHHRGRSLGGAVPGWPGVRRWHGAVGGVSIRGWFRREMAVTREYPPRPLIADRAGGPGWRPGTAAHRRGRPDTGGSHASDTRCVPGGGDGSVAGRPPPAPVPRQGPVDHFPGVAPGATVTLQRDDATTERDGPHQPPSEGTRRATGRHRALDARPSVAVPGRHPGPSGVGREMGLSTRRAGRVGSGRARRGTADGGTALLRTRLRARRDRRHRPPVNGAAVLRLGRRPARRVAGA